MSAHVQVFTFGHALSLGTKAFLSERYGKFRVFKAFYHADNHCDVPATTEAVLAKLLAMGADFSGQTVTLFAFPGLTLGSLTLAAAWMGATGELPVALNLMKGTDGSYVPSPELPVVHLHQFKNQVGRKMRAGFFEGVEEAA